MTSKFTFKTALLYGVLFVVALYFVAPLYVLVISSFKTLNEVRASSIIALPEHWTIDAWTKAWSTACTGKDCNGIHPFFFNTLMIAIPAVIFSVGLGAITGYVMAQWRSKSADVLFSMLLIGSFIPLQLFLVPLAITLRELHIFGTTVGLILLHTIYGLPLTTMLFRNYYVTVPVELVKAAIMDGAGFFTIFGRIILPLSGSIIIVAVILVFSGVYNDFLFALIFGESGNQPIMAAVYSITNSAYGIKDYSVNNALVMISALPTLGLFLIAGKFFVRGLTQGAVKG